MSTSLKVQGVVEELEADLSQYVARPDTPPPALIAPARINPAEAQVMAGVGVSVAGPPRAGTYIQRNFYPLCLVAHRHDLELLPIAAALRRYEWLQEQYYWQAVPADLDQYTAACAAVPEPQGFFIRVKQGAKIPSPVQACLYMTRDNMLQTVHNIVILEAGAELNLLTGCTMHQGL
jgi:hypothetical protein